jgi:hypothetical protein
MGNEIPQNAQQRTRAMTALVFTLGKLGDDAFRKSAILKEFVDLVFGV